MNLLVRTIFCAFFVAVFQNPCFAQKKWGCKYKNASAFTHYQRILEENNQIIYGDYVYGVEIENWNDIEQLVGQVQNALQWVVSQFPYNRMDPITKLFKAITNHLSIRNQTWNDVTPDDFKQIFKNYKPTFKVDSIFGRLTSMLDYFLSSNSKYKDHVHLVTVYGDANEDYVNKQMFKSDIENTFIHNHVAAILKFRHNHSNCYILMDPIRYLVRPILLMETYFDFVPANDRGLDFRMLPACRQDQDMSGRCHAIHPYIIHSVDQQIASHHLYYIKKSYCSMMYETFKQDLLKPVRSIDRSNTDGLCVAIIFASILQNRTDPERMPFDPTFSVATLSEAYDVKMSTFRYTDTRNRLDAVLAQAGVPGMNYIHIDEYKEKIVAFMRVIKHDRFVALYLQLVLNPE